MKFTDELDRLLAGATERPWGVESDGDSSIVFHDKSVIADVYSEMKDTDCNLIAYLANHAAALSAVVKAADESVDATCDCKTCVDLRKALAALEDK